MARNKKQRQKTRAQKAARRKARKQDHGTGRALSATTSTAQGRADEPSYDEWYKAYQLAVQVYELAPWRWMYDSDMFAYDDPEDGTTRFVSVMGRAGEHFAIAVYLDAEGLFRIMDIGSDPETTPPETVLEIPQLQLSFEDKGFLEPEDRRTAKRLGFAFRGANAWPFFRTYKPSMLPWFMGRDELRVLTTALEQVLDVAPRFRDGEEMLEDCHRRAVEENVFLVRTRVETGDGARWQDEMRKIERPPEPELSVPDVNEFLLTRAGTFPATDAVYELELRLMPTPIREKGRKPFFPWIMLLVDSGDGRIVAHEMLTPHPSVDAVYRDAPETFAQLLGSSERRPCEVRVRTGRFASLFGAVCRRLDIGLSVTQSLPFATEAYESLLRMQTPRDF